MDAAEKRGRVLVHRVVAHGAAHQRALHNRRALMRAPPEPADTSSLYFILFSAALWWTFIVGPFNPRWLF